VKECVEL